MDYKYVLLKVERLKTRQFKKGNAKGRTPTHGRARLSLSLFLCVRASLSLSLSLSLSVCVCLCAFVCVCKQDSSYTEQLPKETTSVLRRDASTITTDQLQYKDIF